MTPSQVQGLHAALLESGIPPGGGYRTRPKCITHTLIREFKDSGAESLEFGICKRFLFLSSSFSLSHIHIHQNHRKFKWNNQMKKIKKAQT